MNQMMKIDNNQLLTMSSIEIARLCDKRHDNVMADVRKMLAELGLATPEFSGVYKAGNGQEYDCFNLPRRECDILVAGYSIKYRAAIVDRWPQLEQQHVNNAYQLPDFNNPAVAARAWADAVERGQQLALENQQVRQDLEHLQAHFTDGMRITDFARTLNGVNCQEIQKYLAAIGWLRRDGFSGWRGNSKARDTYLAERTTIWTNPNTGEEQERYYPVLLRAGAVRLFKLYTKEELPMKKTWNGKIGHAAEVMQ